MAEVELIMPKMGESIIEATIINWLKQEGERVDADETVLEIATDKVDSEVPSPVAGVLKKILHQKDEIVSVGEVLAIIESGEQVGQIDTKEESRPAESTIEKESSKDNQSPDQASQQQKFAIPASSSSKTRATASLTRKSLTNQIPSNVDGRFYSPLVRNIARAEGISVDELNMIKGSGAEGRVTKFDLLNYIDLKKLEGASFLKRQETTLVEPRQTPVKSLVEPSKEETSSKTDSAFPSMEKSKTSEPWLGAEVASSGDQVIELTRMRKVIASHMRNSLDTAAHVTSVVEADATKLVQWRNRVKNEYSKKYGEKLTFSPLFAEAVIKSLRDYPQINGSLSGDQLIVKRAINIGIATAMENGNLIVPVIHDAGDLNLNGLAKKLNDLTSRARVNKLKPAEIQGGTFTISNIGTFGNIMGTPIINQPELAVLALGAIKKKPVIQETSEGDIIAIRHMMFLSLSFDHRVIDGYQGGIFLNGIANYIETFDVNRSI